MKREDKSGRKTTRKKEQLAPVTAAGPVENTPRWVWLLPPLLAVLLYAVTLGNGFVLDDTILIQNDSRMGSLGSFLDLRSGELVVRYWSLLLDSVVWGENPMGFHLTNLLLHALTGLAVFGYLRALLRARPAAGDRLFGLAWTDVAALAGGLLFVAHPMQSEAVAGVTHRKEVLATLFMVVALWQALPATRGPGRSLVVGVAFALALFAKAPAVVFLPLALLQDLWVRGRTPAEWVRRDLAFYVPVLAALAGYLFYRWAGLTGAVSGGAVYYEAYNPQAAGLSTGLRLLTAATLLGLYWRLLWIPWRPILERYVEPVRDAADPAAWALVLVALVALAVAFRLGRRRPLPALGLAWLVLAPLPTLNIIPLNFLFSERYLYLPSLGAILIVTGLLAAVAPRPSSRRRLAAAAVGLALLLFAPLVVTRGLEWKNPTSLLAATVRDNASAPRVAFLYGLELRNQGLPAESLVQCRRALAVHPRYAKAWHLAARNHADLGRENEALQAFARAVDLARKPDPAWLHDFAVALIQAGRHGEARPLLDQAVSKAPNNPRFAENRAQLLLLRPETREEGKEALRDLTRRHADYARGWMLLVEAELASGRVAEAVTAANQARLTVTDENVHRYLSARLLEGRGDRAGAAAAYRDLLESADLDPSLRGRVETAARRVATP